jgi:hypothetical protein
VKHNSSAIGMEHDNDRRSSRRMGTGRAGTLLILLALAGCYARTEPDELGTAEQAIGQGGGGGQGQGGAGGGDHGHSGAWTHPAWSSYGFAGASHPINCDGQPNDVFSLGWNTGPNAGPVDPTMPAWMMTFESWYEPLCGGDHLHEWHIQWRGTDGTPRRPLSVAMNPEQAAGSVGIQGDLHVADESNSMLMQVANGTVWTHAAVVRVQPDTPAVMGVGNGMFVEAVRVTSQNEVVIGRNAAAVRIGSGPPPPVANADDLISVLAAMGLVTDAR